MGGGHVIFALGQHRFSWTNTFNLGPSRSRPSRNPSPGSGGHATTFRWVFIGPRDWNFAATPSDGIDLALESLDLLLDGQDAVELPGR